MRQWLKDMRKLKGLSQQNVAEIIGITRQYYQQIEAGERQQKMDITLITKISKAFDISVSQIINNEVQDEKE